MANLASAGFTFVGAVVVGLVLGIAIAKWTHWLFAVPLFVMLGFVAGFVSLYRRLTQRM